MKKKTHTVIRVHKEYWKVPRGFGAAYERRVRDEDKHLAKGHPGEVLGPLSAVLSLVGYEASIAVMAEWTRRQRVEAFVYALFEHLSASDNPVPRHPRPAWMPEPWKGPATRRYSDYLAGPAATVLT